MKAWLTAFALGLYHGVFWGTSMGQLFHFEEGMLHNETCGASSPSVWSVEGSVTLTPGQTFFQPKLVIQTIKTLCTVDLATCSARIPTSTSHQACSCSSQTENSYDIRVGSKVDSSHQGMAVQAVVPGIGLFKNIFGATTIGKVPAMAEARFPIKAFYKINDGPARDLYYEQVVKVCPYQPFNFLICVSNENPDGQLKIEVDLKTTVVTGGSCIYINYELTSDPLEPASTPTSYEDRTQSLTETRTRTLTFEYQEPGKCTNRYYIHFKGDSACGFPTTPGYNSEKTADDASYSNSAEETSNPQTIEETSNPQTIPGICPDTPRTPRTLDDGKDVLMDERSFNKSWIIFQRRVSGAVDFYRPWADYVDGFGDITDSFWMGLRQIHKMCNWRNKCELLVHLAYPDEPFGTSQRSDGCYFARYSEFWLSGPGKKYTLRVLGYSGTAGDSLSYRFAKVVHNFQRFSTHNKDHDNWPQGNCAKSFRGAWWHNDCLAANLNGLWGYQGSSGLGWTTVTGTDSATFTEMKIRRLKD